MSEEPFGKARGGGALQPRRVKRVISTCRVDKLSKSLTHSLTHFFPLLATPPAHQQRNARSPHHMCYTENHASHIKCLLPSSGSGTNKASRPNFSVRTASAHPVRCLVPTASGLVSTTVVIRPNLKKCHCGTFFCLLCMNPRMHEPLTHSHTSAVHVSHSLSHSLSTNALLFRVLCVCVWASLITTYLLPPRAEPSNKAQCRSGDHPVVSNLLKILVM
jgi:hypothetical protein